MKSSSSALARLPPLRTAIALAAGVLCWVAAVYLLQLHIRSGPGGQSIGIRWAPEANELARLTAERRLKLRDGEESTPGTWVYHPADHSRDAVRQIVTHPLVADTSHIDRRAFRVLIDAPALPAWLRRVLETDLGPWIALALGLVGLVAVWPARRRLTHAFDRVGAIPGLELTVAVLLTGLGFAFFHDNGQGVDENIHYDQIARFARGDWSLHPALTTLPGFHAIVAAAVWMTGGATGLSVRIVVLLLSLATVATFHALARTLLPEHAGTRTLQFTLLPILFPQLFLIYTDVTSLLFVLLMMLAASRQRYWGAGALGLAACLVRQNNVIWVAFVMAWTYLRESGWTWRPFTESLARYWTFIATGAGFLLFVAANGGEVAIGEDVGRHPLGSIHFTNIFFLVFLSCFLFVPLWWGYRRELLAHLRRAWPWASLIPLLALFWFGFVNDHPYNSERPDYFLPNAVLIHFSSAPLQRLLFFVPVAVAALSFTAVPLRKPWWLLYPFTILFLLPEWLVVPRYYLIPLSLFLIARAETSPWTERFQVVLFAALSAAAFVTIERAWGWI